ncbi:MAG: NFACT RNA binding domain-containing protein [archaeon]
MMISLDIRKSVEQNASEYFEKAKKERKKIEGVKKTISIYSDKLKAINDAEGKKQQVVSRKKAKQEWYEKFRWFISSDGFLVIGGRDSTTNEIIIKKHTDKDDLVFHTDMAGSPFMVIKREGKQGDFPASTIEEAAISTAVFSRGWKKGMATLSVFSARPEQVTKTPNKGEFLAKGAFFIQGSVTTYYPKMDYAIGALEDGRIMGAPLAAVKKHCLKFLEITQGDDKLSDVAKKVQKELGGELDFIIRALPQNCSIKR